MKSKEIERVVEVNLEENFYFKVRGEVVGQIEAVVSQEMVEMFGREDFCVYAGLFLDKVYEGVIFEDEFSFRREINNKFEELIEALLLDVSTVGQEFENRVGVESFIENSKVNEPYIPDVLFDSDATRYYLMEAMNHRLLTSEEEIMLGRKVQRGIKAKKLGVRTQLLDDLINEGKIARDDLVNHNQRLVVNYAKRKVKSDGNFGDLIQEGNLGLLRAVDKFDPERGFRFSTYATWWIKQNITRGSERDGSQIWIPGHIHDRLGMIRKAEAKLVQNGGVTREKVAKMTNLSLEQVNEVYEVMAKMQNLIELDRPMTIDGDVSFGEMQEDKTNGESSRAGEIREALLAATETLNPRYAHMIRLRFGLLSGEEMTFAQIGEMSGVSKQRISQIVEFGIKIMARDKKIRAMLEEYLSEA